MTANLHRQLLGAETEREVKVAVVAIHSLVFSIRQTGDGQHDPLDELLAWAQEPSVLTSLHVVVFLACLRITYLYQDSLPNWIPLLDAVDGELKRRGEDADAILRGLKERE